MTTSGTYNFNPSLGEIVLNAYARCGVRRTAIMQEHMTDARFETNLMLSSWANQGVNLWEVQLFSIPLVQGVSTYNAVNSSPITSLGQAGPYTQIGYSGTSTYQVGETITISNANPTSINGTYTVSSILSPNLISILAYLPGYISGGYVEGSISSKVVMVLDAVIQQNTGTSSQFDRVIMPISRTEYSQTPNKLLQAPPTVFWFDRLINPTITVWPVPDQTDTYTLNYYVVTQIQDSELTDAQTVDIPYRWLDAMASGLAARLAAIYAPERAQMLDAKAEQAYTIAATQDTENVPLYIMPGLSGYFRVS